MSRFQQGHTKKQGSTISKWGKATAFEGARMVGLVEEDLKASIINLFQELKEIMFTEFKKGYDDNVLPKRETR